MKIAAVGKIKDRWLFQKAQEYQGRIAHDARIEIVEIRDSGVEPEGRRLLEIMGKEGGAAVVLTEEGREYGSREFSKLLESLGPKIFFVIGGPDGVSETVKAQAKVLLSLSRMTFTHEMARLFLLEQIYRALSLLNNRKYHRG